MQSAKNENDRARRDANKADVRSRNSSLAAFSAVMSTLLKPDGIEVNQPDLPGFDLRTFECLKCTVREDMIIQFRMDDGI